MVAEASDTPERLQALAKRVRDQRLALGWSVERLAKRIGLSAGTVKAVERGLRPPSRATLLRLSGLSEFDLDLGDLLFEAGAELSGSLNCYIAPGFDPIKKLHELGEQLNGPGGYIEQTHSYLDYQSAADYYAMSNSAGYIANFRDPVPVERAAQKIHDLCGRAGVDLIALGSGDAREEVRLTRHLIGLNEHPDLRLYLLDISQPLLTIGFRHAADALHDQHGVAYFAMQANFHHLPRYPQVHYTPACSHRRRLFCLLGGTLANLDNEPHFFKHTLVGCAPGDLLLVHLQVAAAPADRPEEIRRRDPALNGAMPPAHVAWLSGPIYRYCKEVQNVQLHLELTTETQVHGSYGLETVATVKLSGGRERRFSMHRWRRYDPERFADCMMGLGWELVGDMRFGEQVKGTGALLLFRKRR